MVAVALAMTRVPEAGPGKLLSLIGPETAYEPVGVGGGGEVGRCCGDGSRRGGGVKRWVDVGGGCVIRFARLGGAACDGASGGAARQCDGRTADCGDRLCAGDERERDCKSAAGGRAHGE